MNWPHQFALEDRKRLLKTEGHSMKVTSATGKVYFPAFKEVGNTSYGMA
jgi:hypothetical protein